MLKAVHEESEAVENRTVGDSSVLDEIVRDGVWQMLSAALQAEVAAYVEAHAGEVDEAAHRLVVRNGHHAACEVSTGAVRVRAPRVNDKRTDATSGERKKFSSAILPAWSRMPPRACPTPTGSSRTPGRSPTQPAGREPMPRGPRHPPPTRDEPAGDGAAT